MMAGGDVNAEPTHTPTPVRRPQVRAVLREGLFVAVLGAVLSFAANSISPRGLVLARNYFPGAIHSPTPTAATPKPAQAGSTNTTVSTAELVAARLKAKGLQLVNLVEMQQLFRDPRYAQQLVVFVDSRDDQHYQAGHVPGAYLFDHYRAEKYLAGVLPVCQAAERIIVYCNGGDCEDSEYAAFTLREVGVPNAKLAVYAGGFTEWQTNAQPIEIGERNSGNLRNVKK